MNRTLRIAVADDEQDMRDYFRMILPRLGHEVVCVAGNGRELVEGCRRCRPDLVITDLKMPELDGLDAATAIAAERPVPVILVTAHHDEALIHRAETDRVAAYLVKPIKQGDLAPTIGLVMRRFDQLQELEKEAVNPRHATEDRQVIETALALVMQRARLTEKDALPRLIHEALVRELPVTDLARALVIAEEVFRDLDHS